jgi:hypothetical protein
VINNPNQSDNAFHSKLLEDLSDVFSIFHDGTIESWSEEPSCVRLKIGCQYIAQKVDPSFDDFYIDLIGITHIQFSPWWKDLEKDTIWTDQKTILDAELGILDGSFKGSHIEITCDQYGGEYDYAGGVLSLACNDFRLYDEVMHPITVEELKTAATAYWTNFGKQ